MCGDTIAVAVGQYDEGVSSIEVDVQEVADARSAAAMADYALARHLPVEKAVRILDMLVELDFSCQEKLRRLGAQKAVVQQAAWRPSLLPGRA